MGFVEWVIVRNPPDKDDKRRQNLQPNILHLREGGRWLVPHCTICLSSVLLPPTGQLHLCSVFSEIFLTFCSVQTFDLLWQQWQVGCIEKAVDLISAAADETPSPGLQITWDYRLQGDRQLLHCRARDVVELSCAQERGEKSWISVSLVPGRVTISPSHHSNGVWGSRRPEESKLKDQH